MLPSITAVALTIVALTKQDSHYLRIIAAFMYFIIALRFALFGWQFDRVDIEKALWIIDVFGPILGVISLAVLVFSFSVLRFLRHADKLQWRSFALGCLAACFGQVLATYVVTPLLH